MGLARQMTSQTPGMPGPGKVDLSILSAIAAPDPEDQRKYDAMGLPDPVAFAALTALGAIPKPMEMLNKMMLAAQDRIEQRSNGQARSGEPAAPGGPAGAARPEVRASGSPAVEPALPPGRSFVDAFRQLQAQESAEAPTGQFQAFGLAAAALRTRRDVGAEVDARAKATQEALEQARVAADRAKEAMQSAAATRDSDHMRAAVAAQMGQARDMAAVFNAEDEPDLLSKSQGQQTLSSLLTGRQGPQDGFVPPGFPVSLPKHLCISNMAKGTGESTVRLECARHGAVSSVLLEADGCTAYVTFASADMAALAAQRLAGRSGLFGAAAGEQPQVRLVGEIPDSARLAAALPVATPVVEQPAEPGELPEYLRPREDRKKKRSKSRRRSRSRSRRKRSRSKRRKARSRSMVRWLDRSRSNSHTATGQYIRATGCSSTVKWWEKKQQASSSSSSSNARRRKKKSTDADEAAARRPRQVAIKGGWAQFVHAGLSYYYHLPTGKTVWERPGELDSTPARRASEAAPRSTACFL